MSLMTRTTFALLPCLAASLATLRAQESTWHWRHLPMPAALENLPPSQLVAGNFTGHGYPDLAFLAGTEVGLLAAPSVHNAIDQIVLGKDAKGLGTLRGAGQYGNDALLIATPAGVLQWQLGALNPLPVIAGGAWYSLAVGNLGNAPETCLVGVSTTTRDQVRVHRIGATLQPAPIGFPGETIAAVQLAQWDGVGGLEICVATNLRLWVGTEASETLFALPLANTGSSHLVRVEMPNRDSLAWLATVADEQHLMTLNSLGQSDLTVQLGNVRELSSGHYDRDLRGDLLVVAQDAHLQLLKNVELSTPSGVAQFVNLPEAIPPVGLQPTDPAMSCAMIVDLNADRRSDLVALQSSSNFAWIRRWVPPFGFNTNRPVLAEGFASAHTSEDTLVCTIPLSSPNSNRPPLATDLELFLFGAAPGTTSPLSLQPVGLQRLRFAGEAIDAFTFTEDLAETNLRVLIGIVRWIRVEGASTVNVWAPTRFAVAHNGMRVVLDAWHALGAVDVQVGSILWSPGFPGNNYVWRPMEGVLIPPPPPPVEGPPRGYEEPPDLPPPPEDPPTPPQPPPPPGG